MVNRSGFSFVAMLVINPIVILFYQNCSFAPLSQAARENPPIVQAQHQTPQLRTISSVAEAPKHACLSSKTSCPSME